jgi:hypothetical protein
MTVVAAWTFIGLVAVVAAFQVALVAGAPWGHLTQGGRHAGPLPASGRAVAAVSIAILLGFAVVVAARAGFTLPAWQPTTRYLVWAVVAYGVLGTFANAVTPSAAERRLWLPIAVAMLVTSLAVALG